MTEKNSSQIDFISVLGEYKKLIDLDISTYCKQIIDETNENFGEYPTEAVRAYCQLLNRGGKRIRGALTITAYKMLGGTDNRVALQAARAIEMLHAYILMADDIQDRSEIRRGGPTAHTLLKQYHEAHNLKDESQHFGESIAINGLLFGAHSALNVIVDLDVPADRKLQAIRNVNKHFIATAHGQSLDIFNEVLMSVDENAVNKVLLWKTAYYSFMNPLQLGAILAGGSENDLNLFEKFSIHAGCAFQITDDILGIYGDEETSGKSPLDDLKEGKRTLLTIKALELATEADANFLQQMLGNKNLTQDEFLRVREIIKNSGALGYAKRKAEESVADALSSLKNINPSWEATNVAFLRQLVTFLIDRKN